MQVTSVKGLMKVNFV